MCSHCLIKALFIGVKLAFFKAPLSVLILKTKSTLVFILHMYWHPGISSMAFNMTGYTLVRLKSPSVNFHKVLTLPETNDSLEGTKLLQCNNVSCGKCLVV